MTQYNRIMLGEHGRLINECMVNSYIGAGFVRFDFSQLSYTDEQDLRSKMIEKYLELNPDKSIGTARMSVGFLMTICFGLQEGDYVLCPDGTGSYRVAKISGDYYYNDERELPHCRPVQWLDISIPRSSMSQALQNSTGSIGTCCNITRYAEEIEQLISGGFPTNTVVTPRVAPIHQNYKERDLHPILAHFLHNKTIIPKTIYHEESNRSERAQRWVHPDMVAVRFNEFQSPETNMLLKAAETKDYVDFFSFELKRSIDSDNNLKEYFFQALSNSSWANYGYLVAFDIKDDQMDELERLNRSFGIGVIKLSSDGIDILFQARKNELDYYTIDKLCRINDNFKSFISKVNNVITAKSDYVDDVRRGLKSICDKGFESAEELRSYCQEKGVPC